MFINWVLPTILGSAELGAAELLSETDRYPDKGSC
jgi:hypothetical protein